MMDNKPERGSLKLRSFLSSEDIDKATVVWVNNRIKKGKSEPSVKHVGVVQQLALDLFLPILESNHTLAFVEWDLIRRYDEYAEITQGLTPKELVGVDRAALNLGKRLHRVALRKKINSNPHVIQGDVDFQKRMPRTDWEETETKMERGFDEIFAEDPEFGLPDSD